MSKALRIYFLYVRWIYVERGFIIYDRIPVELHGKQRSVFGGEYWEDMSAESLSSNSSNVL